MANKIFLFVLLLASCSPDLSDDPIPFQPFPEILIDLNLPEYVKLKTNGGNVYLNDGGVRGLILYRLNTETYFAYERNCSFHPQDACATVDADLSGLYMIDHCCGSTFSYTNGQPTGGIAWRPLRRYATRLDANILKITDEIID